MSYSPYPDRVRARKQALRQIGYVTDGLVLQRDVLYPYSPQAHGARGDGVHDDTEAVQAALDRGWTHFPAGAYLVSGPIPLPS